MNGLTLLVGVGIVGVVSAFVVSLYLRLQLVNRGDQQARRARAALARAIRAAAKTR